MCHLVYLVRQKYCPPNQCDLYPIYETKSMLICIVKIGLFSFRESNYGWAFIVPNSVFIKLYIFNFTITQFHHILFTRQCSQHIPN